MIRVALVAALLVLGTTVARADQATAASAFNQAEALVKEGKWAQACPLYETSYKADQQIGVLLHLADCNEHVGLVATAWAQFRDAAELANKKGDPREAFAQGRSNKLEPKLAKLRLTPQSATPGLEVRRDKLDVTALLGAEIPIDPGDHEISATAPGYISWKDTVSIAGAGTTTVKIPGLELVPEAPEGPNTGKLVVVTQDDALISIDSKEVGRGRFEGDLSPGGHTLRVVAEGMRPYQSEITVALGGTRRIEVPLEKIEANVVFVPRDEESVNFELGVSLASGVKLRGDRPTVAVVRGELALRLGARVNLGLFAEYGRLSTEGSCGFDMVGPVPETPFDFGERIQFNNCSFVMPGVQLYIHILPESRVDPYLGVAPGFRFGFTDWTPYDAGQPQRKQSENFLAIVVGLRGGVNYRPRPSFPGWEVGAYAEASITAIGDETNAQPGDGDNRDQHVFVSLLGGLRSTVAF